MGAWVLINGTWYYTEPVTAAGLGVTLLGEALAPVQIAGIALVVTALIGATLWQPRLH